MFCKLLEKYWIVFKIDSKEPNILAAVIGSLLWDSCLKAQNSKTEERIYQGTKKDASISHCLYQQQKCIY